MAPSSYHQLHSLHNSDPTTASDLYCYHEYNEPPVHPFDSSRSNTRTTNSDGNGYNSNDHRVPSTEPPRPNLYTAQSSDDSHHKPPQHSMSDMPTNQPLQSASHSYNTRPHYPIDPPTKPLVHSSHIAGQEPLAMQTPPSRLSQRRYQNLQRYLRIGKTISNAITMIFSAIILAITLYIFITFETTNDDFRGGRTAWPKQTKLWPMIMLFVCAAVTLLLTLGTLFYYCCAYNKAKRSWKVTLVRYVIHIGAWLVVSALYRYEKGMTDLWGWSCSAKAAGLQSQFNGVVDFSSLCRTQ